jgi:hypothetical protein
MTLPGSTPRATRIEAKVWRSLWGVSPPGSGTSPASVSFSLALSMAFEDAAADVALDQFGTRGGGEHERRQQRASVDQSALLVVASVNLGVAVEFAGGVEQRLDVLCAVEPYWSRPDGLQAPPATLGSTAMIRARRRRLLMGGSMLTSGVRETTVLSPRPAPTG